MPAKQNLGFKSAARLEQVGKEHSKAMEDRKHRFSWCGDSTRVRDVSRPGRYGAGDGSEDNVKQRS
jgi:hypothetical protein